MSTGSIVLREARGVADVLNVTFRLLRARWRLFLKTVFYFGAPPVILGFGCVVGAVVALVFGLDGGESSSGLLGGAFLGLGMGMLFLMVGSALAVTGMLAIVRLYDERGAASTTVGEVWSVSISRFPGVLGLQILNGLAILLLMPIVAIPCLGALAFVAWTLFVTVRYFYLAIPVRVLDDRSAFNSISHAGTLVQNSFWETAGVFFVIYVVQTIFSSAFMLPFQVVVYGGELHNLNLESLPGWMIAGFAAAFLMGLAGSVLMTGVMYVAAAVQTYALKERKEDAGVEARVEQLEREVQNPQVSETVTERDASGRSFTDDGSDNE